MIIYIYIYICIYIYTNIPHEDVVKSVQFFINDLVDSDIPPTKIVVETINLVLKNNVFKFEDTVYLQTHGTAMGTPMAPSVANLFMGWLEKQMLDSSPVQVNTGLWKRYIDDIFLLWAGNNDDLLTFYRHINSFHPTIKFTMQSSKTDVSFLDIHIKLQDGLLHTDMYTKPTDRKAYLPSSSCHPKHCINNIPFSQLLRARRLCSKDEDFESQANSILEAFKRRGYPTRVLNEARRKVHNIPRSQTLHYKQKDKHSRVPFIITHNPANPPLRKWLMEKQQSLHRSERMKKAMPHVPVVGERNSKSLRTILMPTILPPEINTSLTPGIILCDKKCIACRKHMIQTSSFNSHISREVFSIRHPMSCTSKNIIYLLFCAKCNGAQYIGETRNTIKQRIALHRSHINYNKGTHVTRHFNSDSHSLDDMRCIPIEQILSLDHKARKQREAFWISKLKTRFPQGLNTRYN